MKKPTPLLLPILLLLACGPAPEAEGPDAELCEHMAEGPAESVTAGVDLDSAPDISREHTRYDVALDGEGVVAYAADEATALLVALDADAPLSFLQAGAELTVEESRGTEACSEVGRVHLLEVELGTLEIRIGPTELDELRFVIEHAGAHEEEE